MPVMDSVLVQFGQLLLKLAQYEEPPAETKAEPTVEAFPSLPSYSLEFNHRSEI